jgi:kynureninase
VIPDYRVPNQIRVAISPLATSFMEVFEGFERIRRSVAEKEYIKIDSSGTRVT